ncbi:hypothetical protein IJS77_05605, partial [bacterium]|nr:hypothetical protein [bacterium]
MSFSNFNVENFKVNQNYNKNGVKKHNCLSPLRCDTVSFGALKKTQFQGIDLLVVNKFKAPIEKFNTNEDLQNWCKKKVDNIVNKDYKGRQQETVTQRKTMLKEWFDYVQKENDAYTGAISLLILDGITKDLKPNEDSLPPVLNKEILADTISQIQEKAKDNPKFDANFSKIYQMNLQKGILKKDGEENYENKTGWVVISNNILDFEHNLEKMKLLSHNNWCTKSWFAEHCLRGGDFHIYLENGKPKLAVRFFENVILEVQGEKNNYKIPFRYFDILMEHIDENVKKNRLSEKAKEEIGEARKIKEQFDNIKDMVKNASSEEIYKIFGIDVKKDKDGLLILSEYSQPKLEINNNKFTYNDFDIDENKLLKNVKTIEGHADFSNSKITNLVNLQTIGGVADFRNSQIINLGNLQTIGGEAYFSNSKITNLGNLQTIGG